MVTTSALRKIVEAMDARSRRPKTARPRIAAGDGGRKRRLVVESRLPADDLVYVETDRATSAERRSMARRKRAQRARAELMRDHRDKFDEDATTHPLYRLYTLKAPYRKAIRSAASTSQGLSRLSVPLKIERTTGAGVAGGRRGFVRQPPASKIRRHLARHRWRPVVVWDAPAAAGTRPVKKRWQWKAL